MAKPEISKFLAPILLTVLAFAIIESDISVSAESNLMGVYVDVTGDKLDGIEKRFDFSRGKGKGHVGRRRPEKLRNKHKHTKSSYGVPKSQYEASKPYSPSKTQSKPQGKYPPKTQYSLGPVNSYVAPAYNTPTYSLPAYRQSAHRPPAVRPQSSRPQSSRRPSPQASVAHRPSHPSPPRYKNSPPIYPQTAPPTRPKSSPTTRPKTSPPTPPKISPATSPKASHPTHPKTSPPTSPKTSPRPSSHRPTYPTTSLPTTTSPSTTTSTRVYSSPAPVSSATTTTTSSPIDTSPPAYNSSIPDSSTTSAPESSSSKTGSSQSKKKYAPPKKEMIIPLKLKNEVQIKPAYTPKTSPKGNSTSPVSILKDEDNEGFFSSPSEGFPNFFKQLLQG